MITEMPVAAPRSQTWLYPEDDRVTDDGKHVSETVYWEDYYNHPELTYEWNNGILEVRPMSDFEKSKMYRWFLRLLECFLSTHDMAEISVLEIGFRLHLTNGTVRVRIPDMGVVRHDNIVPAEPDDRLYRGTFDICIESISDSKQKEIDRDRIDKKLEYEDVGVKEYYILDDKRNRYMVFYRLNQWGLYDEIQPNVDGVIQSDVLPGFQFRLEDLYRQPPLIKMAEDPVYQDFVWLDYQEQKQYAEQKQIELAWERLRVEEEAKRATEQAKIAAEQVKIAKEQAKLAKEQAKLAKEQTKLAEAERLRAEQEKQRADTYAAMLEKFGISLD